MIKNKNHWYDGWFYDRIIAPNQDPLFSKVKNLIEPHSKVIDIGCGTGRLAFALADECHSVLGIDLSKRNIDRAQLMLQRRPNDRISFQHLNVSDTPDGGEKHFDYAVLTYVIHEVSEQERISLLNEAFRVADKVIIGDYLSPKPKGFRGFISESIEFMAGRKHYENYKSFMSNGGIHHLVNRAGLKIIYEIGMQQSIDHLVVLSR